MFGSDSNELRQRLINLMYLVFITLAFIYLPSEFIDSSKYLRISFNQSAKEYQQQLDRRQNMLDEQLYFNSPLAEDYYSIMEISADIDTAVSHIERMNQAMITGVGGYSMESYINKSKNFLIAGKLIVEGGQATQLREQIEGIRQKIRSFNLEGIAPYMDSLLPSGLTIQGSSGKTKIWEDYFFGKTPTAIVVTNLAKIKADLLFTKLKLADYLTSNISSAKSDKNISILSSNSVAVEVLASRNYQLGDKIVFHVQLQDSGKGYGGIKAYVKEGEKVVRQLSVSPNGLVTFRGNKTGSYQLVVEGDSTIMVKQNFTITNLRTAFTEKNNPEVMYLGIDNPVEVHSTGFQVQNLQLELDFGEVIPFKGNYYLRFDKEGIAHLKIVAFNEEGSYPVAEKAYMVKKLPAPEVTLDGRAGGNISRKILHVQEKLVAGLGEIPADAYKIISYEVIKVNSRSKEAVTNRGDAFTRDARNLVKNTTTGDLLVIDNIKVQAVDGTLKEAAPVVFSVK